MGKKEDLETLDDLIRQRMIDILQVKDGSLDELSSLSVPVNYLKANAVVSEKPKSTIEDDVKKRREAAEKRRKAGESK